MRSIWRWTFYSYVNAPMRTVRETEKRMQKKKKGKQRPRIIDCVEQWGTATMYNRWATYPISHTPSTMWLRLRWRKKIWFLMMIDCCRNHRHTFIYIHLCRSNSSVTITHFLVFSEGALFRLYTAAECTHFLYFKFASLFIYFMLCMYESIFLIIWLSQLVWIWRQKEFCWHNLFDHDIS